MHTETVHDSFFGSGEQEWCDDGWLGDDDYHSVAGPRTVYGLWQETDEDDATRYDADWEEDSWIGIESCLRNSHTMLRRFSGWSAAGERDDDTDAV